MEEQLTIRKIYLTLDEIERMPADKTAEINEQLRRYIALRREIEQFLIRTTGTL